MRHTKKGDIMLNMLYVHPVLSIVLQVDIISKVILGLLLIMSLSSWSVFLYKLMLLRKKKRHMQQTFFILDQISTIEDLTNLTESCSETTPGNFLIDSVHYFNRLVALQGQHSVGKLTNAYWDQLQENMYYMVDMIIYQEESLLWILSTSAGVATLLGLFGTIWGLIHAFISIGKQQAVDIVIIAPGIAEALVTTLAGLIVAIPALIMFNYIQTYIKHLEQQLCSLIQRFNRIIQIKFTC